MPGEREELRDEFVVMVTGFDGSDEEVTTWVASALDRYADAVAAPLVEALLGCGRLSPVSGDGLCWCRDFWRQHVKTEGHLRICQQARAALAAYEAGK